MLQTKMLQTKMLQANVSRTKVSQNQMLQTKKMLQTKMLETKMAPLWRHTARSGVSRVSSVFRCVQSLSCAGCRAHGLKC